MNLDSASAHAYLTHTISLTNQINCDIVSNMARELDRLRLNKGRLFFIGNGGGQAHSSHAAADFRKIAKIESYAWGDNTGDATAYTNDLGWEASVSNWLSDSNFDKDDGLFVFSVGGTSDETSANLRWALSHCKGSLIMGITGEEGKLKDYASKDCQLVLNCGTSQCEGLQAVVWHCLVEMLRVKAGR